MDLLQPTPFLDTDDDRHMLPCRFFAHGYCHKGNRCRFYHPTPASLRTSIRVPPLPPGFEFGNTGMGRRPIRERVAYPQGPRQRPIPPFRPFNNLTNRFRDRGAMRRPHLTYSDPDYYDSEPAFYAHAEPEIGRVPLFVPPSISEEYNTLFKHINWIDFLAPGQLPPIPTIVPMEHDEGERRLSLVYNAATRRVAEHSTQLTNSKLTPKEELHVKLKEIAKELKEAKEVVPVRPKLFLDSYFLKYKLSQEQEAMMVAPDEISRVVRENTIVNFPDGGSQEATPEASSSRDPVVEQAVDGTTKKLDVHED